MVRFATRRLLAAIPLLLIVYTIAFFLVHSAPGSPWSGERAIPPAARERLRQHYLLDEPLWEQYSRFLWNLVRHWNLGPTYGQNDRSVNEVLSDALFISAQLGAAAIVVAVCLGVPAGILGAIRYGGPADYAVSVTSALAVSVPEFVTAPLLILVLAQWLHLVPTAGWNGIFNAGAVVPVLALAIRPAASIARYTRTSMLDVLGSDYLTVARAKGLHERVVIIRHGMRNALVPIVTVIGNHIPFIVTGSFYIEVLCGIPGFGRLFVNSIASREYSIVLGATIVVGTSIIVINVAVDLLYAVIDPRIRHR